MGLLQDIQHAATNSERSVTDLLRMAIVLARRLRHDPLAHWARRELDGYFGEASQVPEYRRLKNGVLIGQFLGPFGSAVKNSPIPLDSLPKEVRESIRSMPLVEPIASYEAATGGESGTLTMPLPQVVSIFGRLGLEYWRGYTLAEAELRFSSGVVRGVIDAVRTRLLEFALEIEAVNPAAGEAPSIGPPPVAPPVVQQLFDSTIFLGGSTMQKQTTNTNVVVGSEGVQIGQGERLRQEQTVTTRTGIDGDDFVLAIKALRRAIDSEISDVEARADAQELVNELEARACSPGSPVVRAVCEALTRFAGAHPGLAEALATLGVVLGCAAGVAG